MLITRTEHWLLVLGITIASLPAVSPAGGYSPAVRAGERIRFVRLGHEAREATALYSTADVVVAQYDGNEKTYPDTLRLDSLESLDVLRGPMSLFKGCMGGIILGALGGTLVGVAKYSPSELGGISVLFYVPIGAVVGGVAGVGFAALQGEQWEGVPLGRGNRADAIPPNTYEAHGRQEQ